MTRYDYSTRPAPTVMTPRFIANTAYARSSLTKRVQTISRPGEHWELDVSWRELTYDAAAQVFGFFTRLNGGEHRVYFQQMYGHTQSGSPAGSPLVAGGSQVGYDLDFDGVAAITDYFKAGDLFSYFNGTYYELKMVVADLTTTTGTNNVEFVPAIRTSPANNAAVVHNGVNSEWILTSPVNMIASARKQDHLGRALYDIDLAFTEEIQ